MSCECMFLGSLSRHNKDLEQWTLKPWCVTALGSWTNRATALRQISVTALFYLEDSRREREREKGRKRERERERVRACTHARGTESPRESASAPPFIRFFLHLHLPYANWA